MFLGVSGTVLAMEMSEQERLLLAALFRGMRMWRFKGNRKAAYTAAGVNSATWARLEQGLSVKEQTLSKVLSELIPETAGDWTNLVISQEGNFIVSSENVSGDRTVGGRPQDADYVASPGARAESGISDDAVLAELRAVREEVRALRERLADLEQHGS